MIFNDSVIYRLVNIQNDKIKQRISKNEIKIWIIQINSVNKIVIIA